MGWVARLGMGTKVVKNGHEGVSDVHWGWFFRALVVMGLGLTAAGVQRAFYISAKMDVLEERAIITQREAESAAAAAKELGEELKRRVDNANKEHERYLTRDEFFNYMAPEIRRRGSGR